MSQIDLIHAKCVAAMITFECDEETYNKAQCRIKEAGKQQPLPLARAKATQLQLGE